MNQQQLHSLGGVCIALWVLTVAVYASSSSPAAATKKDGEIFSEPPPLFGLAQHLDASSSAAEEGGRPSLLAALADFLIGRKENTPAEQVVLQQQLLALEEDLAKVDVQEAALRERKKHLDRYVAAAAKEDATTRNEVVDQLVEAELERLDTLEWRLARIRARLTSTLRAVDLRIQQTQPQQQ